MTPRHVKSAMRALCFGSGVIVGIVLAGFSQYACAQEIKIETSATVQVRSMDEVLDVERCLNGTAQMVCDQVHVTVEEPEPQDDDETVRVRIDYE